jgi:hypothetical protein
MTFVTLGSGCGGLPGCYGFRGLVVSYTGSSPDGVCANMLAWLNGSAATAIMEALPWGIIQSNTFSDLSLTTPDNLPDGTPVNASNPGPDGVSQWFMIDNTGAPFVEPTGQRCQVYWPAGSNYGVIAVDSWNALQTAWICCTGVTGACGGSIMELPAPNSSLPSPIPWNRLHYIAHLGLTPANIDAYYVSQLAFGVPANYNTGTWNTAQVCLPSPIATPTDPFDGGDP